MSRKQLFVIFGVGLLVGVVLVIISLSRNNSTFQVSKTDPAVTVMYDPEFEKVPSSVPTVSSLVTKITITMSSAIDPSSKVGVTTNNQDSFSTSISDNKLVLSVISTSKHLKGGSSYSLAVSGVRSAKSKKSSSFIMRFKTDGVNQVDSFNQTLPYLGNGFSIIYSFFGNYYTVITERGFDKNNTKKDALAVLEKNGINSTVVDLRYESR